MFGVFDRYLNRVSSMPVQGKISMMLQPGGLG